MFVMNDKEGSTMSLLLKAGWKQTIAGSLGGVRFPDGVEVELVALLYTKKGRVSRKSFAAMADKAIYDTWSAEAKQGLHDRLKAMSLA